MHKKQAYKEIIMTFVRGYDPIWKEFDLSGNIFDDTFYLFVLQNDIPYMPETVWQDPYGNVVWSNPIQFYANGTLPDNIYFDPDTVYRLEFRQGDTQSDPLIYVVENYVPGSSGDNPIADTTFSTDNQITNPQFSIVNFTSPLTLSSISTQTIDIAPGWFLHLAGNGNVTLTQVTLNSSVSDPTNASYALQIQLSGSWSNAYLSQKFQRNGVLWSNTFLSSSIMALSGDAPQTISASLVNSQGATVASLLSPVSLTETFNSYPGVVEVPASTNTDLPPTAYVEYRLALPSNCNITLSSVQMISGDVAVAYPYEQTTLERQEDQTFHYYRSRLSNMPIPNWLIGWDFGLNPCQILGHNPGISGLGNNLSRYIADQTISFESVGNVVSYAFTKASGITASTTGTTQIALVQYLEANSCQEIINQLFSMKLSGSVSVGTLSGTISVYWTSSSTLPNVAPGTNLSLVSAMNAGGIPTIGNGSWTEITRASGIGRGTFQLTTTNNTFDFNSYDATSQPSINTATYLAIVIGFDSMISSQTFTLKYCTLNSGNIATPPPAMTFQQTLSALEYYYEQSYPYINIAGGTTTTNQVSSEQGLYSNVPTAIGMYARNFSFKFRTQKVKAALVTLYSTVTPNAPGTVRGIVYNNNVALNTTGTDITVSSAWSSVSGEKGINYTSNVSPASPLLSQAGVLTSTNAYTVINFQYVADARLGIVL